MRIHFINNVLLIFVLSSCSVVKYIPEDKYLYDGVEIKLKSENEVKNKAKLKEVVQDALFPKPNKTVLGARLGLLLHYRAKKRKLFFISRFLNRKVGEKPVYFSDVNLAKQAKVIENRLNNNGYFKSNVSYKTSSDGKFKKLIYDVDLVAPYKLKTYELDSGIIRNSIYDDLKLTLNSSTIKKESLYNLELLKDERNRIESELKEKGYYKFNSEYIIFQVDTNRYENNSYDLYLSLKSNIPVEATKKYRINELNIYPNYTISIDTLPHIHDTINGVVFHQQELYFKPHRLIPYILLEPGTLYNPQKSSMTKDRLSNIGSYKFVNIQYEVLDSLPSDSSYGLLNARINLSPLTKYAFGAQIQATSKSNNFIGPGLNLSFADRNLFKGGETWGITGNLGYERQFFVDSPNKLNSIQYGISTDITFPRMLFPIQFFEEYKHAVPKTRLKLGIERLNRAQLYKLTSVNSSFGYSWNENRYKYHELNPVNLSFVRLSNTTTEFEEILNENQFLRNSFRQEFIAGITYSFTYNKLNNTRIKNPGFLSATADIAGNAVSLLSSFTGESDEFLGLEYAQYAKFELDLRKYFKFKNDQVFISRFFTGVGLPYSNSDVLPFSKQFFSGGAYSVRSFQIRSLGPGTYNPESSDQGAFFDRSGDLKLEANLEYRFPIISYLEGAVFSDIGNIWLLNENTELPGGKIESDFYKELAWGAGLGLRLNIQNFAIRLDAATPLNTPYFQVGERFNPRLSKTIVNFAIGYPF